MRKFSVSIVLLFCLMAVISGCSSETGELLRIDKIFQKGEYEKSLAETEAFLKKYPDSHRGWNIAGWSHMYTGDLEKAGECFDKSIAIKPDWDNAYVGRGVICRKQGDLAGARKNYEKAISVVPENAEALSSLLVVELMEKNYEKAIKHGEAAWAIRQNLASIPANLCIAYHYAGNIKKRDYYFKKAKDLGYKNLQTLQDIIDGKLSI